ncbi:MAG: hypothetical protein KF692_04150 [Cryobacterium sp.]|nr:hypothetical protein [Cryobacterium sp.]
MNSRKTLAMGSTLLLIVALFTAGFSSAAAADPVPATPTGSLSGVATCDTSDGSATVTWTLTNNADQRMWVTWSANGYVPNTASLAAHASETFTTAVSSPAAGKTLNETVKLRWSDGSVQGKTPASVTVGSGCLPPAVAVGTLTAAATCNADGSGTVTWTLTNEYDRTMSVTWTANSSISSQNNTVAPRASKTFTKSIAAPAGGKSAGATIKLSWRDGSAQGKTSASATVPTDCAPAPVAAGTLVASATCNADGSGTVTWTLTNEYNGVMSVTWSANAYISNQTTVAALGSKTFTKTIAAPAAGKSLSETVKLSWRDGSSQGKTSAGATVGSDCATPPPPPVCAASDFTSANMWEVTWGYDFEHRNGGAPLFTLQSNGGLTQLNGGPVPSYMTGSWHWLYVGMGTADRVWTYTFADGTVRTATVTGADCTPTIVWATIPPPAPNVTFTHSEVCGQITLGVDSNATVGATWYYGLKATVDGTLLGSVLQQGPGSKTTTLTLPEDSYGGSAVVTVFVHAATEWSIISPAELDYQSTWPNPGSHVWLITVDTDCLPPVPITSAVSASFVDHTCSALGSMTLTGEHATWTVVSDHATAAGPGGTVITGVPSGVWPALLDGASPQSSTNTPYYGSTMVTAVADPGYSLAPYSESFVAHEPTGCGDPAPTLSFLGTGGTGGGSSVGGGTGPESLETLAITDTSSDSSASSSSTPAASGTSAGDLETRVVTATGDDGVWLWYVGGFLLFGVFFIVIVWWRRRKDA